MTIRHSNYQSQILTRGHPTLDMSTFPESPPWMVDGLCAQTDPESFFPEKGGSTREAKSICARCPVAAECLDWALEHEERFGIWGGLSERERRKVARSINPPTDDNHTNKDTAA
jgi:WhiB family redox-sensing transcriptional regulator